MSDNNHPKQTTVVPDPDVQPWQAMMRTGLVTVDANPPLSGDQTIQEIPVAQIQPSPHQVRKHFDLDELGDLAASIRDHGVLQPIKVVRRTDDDGEVFYELIFGERRWRAATRAGLDTIPAIVASPDDDETRRAVQGLIENLHRADLNPMETLAGLKYLMSLTNSDWASLPDLVGKSKSIVYYYRSLDQMPDEIQEWVAAGKLTIRHIRALSRIEKPNIQMQLAELAVTSGITGRALAEIVRSIQGGEKVESAVMRTTGHRRIPTPEPFKDVPQPAVANDGDKSQKGGPSSSQKPRGVTGYHQAVMHGLSKQRLEDLTFEVEQRELHIPNTRHAAAIMRRNTAISAGAAATYAQLFEDHALYEWVKDISFVLGRMAPRVHEDLPRAARTVLLSVMPEQIAELQKIVEVVQQADDQAKS